MIGIWKLFWKQLAVEDLYEVQNKTGVFWGAARSFRVVYPGDSELNSETAALEGQLKSQVGVTRPLG